MIRIAHLIFSEKEYVVIINSDNKIAKELIRRFPLKSEAQNIGGEIYFRIPGIDIKYDGTECEEFEIGDVVYRRFPIAENKFAIALFYGSIQYSNYKSPRLPVHVLKLES